MGAHDGGCVFDSGGSPDEDWNGESRVRKHSSVRGGMEQRTEVSDVGRWVAEAEDAFAKSIVGGAIQGLPETVNLVRCIPSISAGK